MNKMNYSYVSKTDFGFFAYFFIILDVDKINKKVKQIVTKLTCFIC